MSEYQKGRERGYELGKLTAVETISDLSETIEALRAENEKLRAALKPFAFAKVDRTFPKMLTFSITFEDKDGDPFENAIAAIRETGD